MRPLVQVDAYAGLHPASGIGRYVQDLSQALLTRPDAPPARFSYPADLRERGRRVYPPDRRHELPLPWRALAPVLAGAAMLRWPLDSLYGAPAVFHSTLGYGPPFSHTRLIEHVHDLTWLDHPEWHPRRAQSFFGATVPAAVRAAAVVLTHSRHVADRVSATYAVPRSRLVTIPPPLGHGFHPIGRGAAQSRVRERFGLEGPYILHVGTVEPRKNHAVLVRGFERMRRAGFPGPLVLVGRDGWRVGPILRQLETSPAREAIRRLDGLEDTDLVALYGACTVCAFPSLEEGFGMPLLESMACGAACVTSDHPALVELGEGCALAVPARDEEALAEVLLALWRDPERRAALAAPGPKRAEEYAFQRWAGRIFELYRRELAAVGVAGRAE